MCVIRSSGQSSWFLSQLFHLRSGRVQSMKSIKGNICYFLILYEVVINNNSLNWDWWGYSWLQRYFSVCCHESHIKLHVQRLCRADLTIVSTSANFELQNRKFLYPKQTLTFQWHSIGCPLCHCLKNSHSSPGAQVVVLCLALCCLASLAALTVHYVTVEFTWGLKVRNYCSKCCERKNKQKNYLVRPVLIIWVITSKDYMLCWKHKCWLT